MYSKSEVKVIFALAEQLGPWFRNNQKGILESPETHELRLQPKQNQGIQNPNPSSQPFPPKSLHNSSTSTTTSIYCLLKPSLTSRFNRIIITFISIPKSLCLSCKSDSRIRSKYHHRTRFIFITMASGQELGFALGIPVGNMDGAKASEICEKFTYVHVYMHSPNHLC